MTFEGILFICARVVSFANDTTRAKTIFPKKVILLSLLSIYKAKLYPDI